MSPIFRLWSAVILFLFFLPFQYITAQLNYSVTSAAATGAYDDPDTETDESMDGICADEDGNCTLTAAIQEANNLEEPVIISFAGPMTITLDGGAQLLSGSKMLGGGFEVKIIFSSPGTFEFEDDNEIKGITIEHGGITLHNNNTVKGCTFIGSLQSTVSVAIIGANNVIGGLSAVERNIFRSAVTGITIGMDNSMTGGFNQILGNYIGVEATGSSADGNMIGMIIQGESGQGENLIEGNVISGNTSYGISLLTSDKNIIRNNKIGTGAGGTQAVKNHYDGISLFNSQENLIEHNVISGNGWSGISFIGSSESLGESSFNTVKFNFIGVNKDTLPIPNEKHGIEFIGKTNNNIIGSTLENDVDTNVIAHNGLYGIIVIPDTLSGPDFPHGNIFRRNRMYGNSEPGILVNPKTQEDIARPAIDSVQQLLSLDLVVHGSAKPKSVVDVYMASTPDPNKYGEGRDWLGKGVTNDSGRFAVNIGAPQLNCDLITALQTDEQNNTSGNAKNVGIAPLVTSLTQHCDPPLFGGVAYANNKYTIHINWKGLPKEGEVEFNLNGNKKPGIINGDIADVEYNMSQTVVGTNTLSWTLNVCDGRLATGMSSIQFCGNPVPDWLSPVTAECSGGHMSYTHLETFPDDALAAAGATLPPDVPFVAGLLMSFTDAPTFSTTLHIPGTSDPVSAGMSFDVGENSFGVSIGGTVATSFANCNSVEATGTLTLTAGVARTFSYGVSFGEIPCPSIPALQQLCQLTNAMANSLRVGATLSGEVTATANLQPGIEIAGGGGGATLALTPFLDVLTFHARGRGEVGFSVQVPPFSVTDANASVEFTISEEISGLTKSWGYPSGRISSRALFAENNSQEKSTLKIPYTPVSLSPIGVDTVLETGLGWNAHPVFAAGSGGVKAFAWVEHRISNGILVSDIAVKYFNGSTWGPAIALTNDDNVDRNPAIAVDGSGNIVVCWERNTTAQAPPESLQYETAFLKNINIMFAVMSSANGSQMGSGMLGNANTFDALPKLARGKEGSVTLAWQVNGGENLFGTEDSPLSIVSSRLSNGTQWTSVDTIVSRQSKVFQWNIAAHDAQNAILTMAKDLQGDLASPADWEIFSVKRTNGVWGTVQQLTSNSIMEFGVNSAFTQDGTPVVVWMRDTSVIGSYGAAASPQELWIPKAGSGFFNNSFTIGSDTMALSWNEGSSAVVATASVNNRVWTAPKFPHFTTDIQRSVSTVLDAVGSLHIGYFQSPYNEEPDQLPDSGSLRLISIEKASSPLGIKVTEPSVPNQFALFDAYPNPFNPSTTIRYDVPALSQVRLSVYDLLGREIAVLVNEQKPEGSYSFHFTADNLPSGVYFCVMHAENPDQALHFVQTKKLILLK